MTGVQTCALPISVLSSPGAFGVTPWVDHARGIAGVFFVEDQLLAVNADINAIRAMVNTVTAEGRGRRVAPVLPAVPAVQQPKANAMSKGVRMPDRDASNRR